VRHQIQTLIRLMRRVGTVPTLLFLADSLLVRLCRARILLVLLRGPEEVLREPIDLPAGFTTAVRSAEEMKSAGGFCAATLSDSFLSEASSRGDRCVVILDRGEVVNFQWVSSGLTLAYDDIWIGFGPRYLYGYNSLTAPSHRGRGLNRSAVAIAGRLVAVPQGKGMSGYINASNTASLLSQWNPATQAFGFALVWPRAHKRTWVLATRVCRGAGLTVTRR